MALNFNMLEKHFFYLLLPMFSVCTWRLDFTARAIYSSRCYVIARRRVYVCNQISSRCWEADFCCVVVLDGGSTTLSKWCLWPWPRKWGQDLWRKLTLTVWTMRFGKVPKTQTIGISQLVYKKWSCSLNCLLHFYVDVLVSYWRLSVTQTSRSNLDPNLGRFHIKCLLVTYASLCTSHVCISGFSICFIYLNFLKSV